MFPLNTPKETKTLFFISNLSQVNAKWLMKFYYSVDPADITHGLCCYFDPDQSNYRAKGDVLTRGLESVISKITFIQAWSMPVRCITAITLALWWLSIKFEWIMLMCNIPGFNNPRPSLSKHFLFSLDNNTSLVEDKSSKFRGRNIFWTPTELWRGCSRWWPWSQSVSLSSPRWPWPWTPSPASPATTRTAGRSTTRSWPWWRRCASPGSRWSTSWGLPAAPASGSLSRGEWTW